MQTGIVKFYNESKGFGFIKDDATSQEIFVHATGLIDRIKENDKVSYELTEGKRGPSATDVKKI